MSMIGSRVGSPVEEEDIDPKAYFVCTDQVWDPHVRTWVTKKAELPKSRKSLLFRAYNREYGNLGPSTDDHLWIDLESQTLIDFLRAEESLKGMTGLAGRRQPGIDGRNLFLRLHRLKKLAVEPKIDENAVSDGTEPNCKPDEQDSGMAKSLTAPEQLFVLVKFIEEHFRETIEVLERLQKDGYMSFDLLWTMCVPESVVETEDGATEYPIGVKVNSWSYDCGPAGPIFYMKGSGYVWDGKEFKWDQVSRTVNAFKELKKVDQLPFKILSEAVRASLVDRGKLYERLAGVHHLQYNSLITIETRMGYAKRQAQGRVMVDTEGHYRFNPNASGGPKRMGGYESPHYLIPAPRYRGGPPDPDDDEWFPEGPRQGHKKGEPLADDLLCLLPPAHYGWSFTAKLWGLILVEDLQEIKFDEMAFNQLVLKQEYKKMIKALIETHAGRDNVLLKDLVGGKGGGMVMVLHGQPGTGKTLTAEAISEHLKRPFYTVSSGELGIDAAGLETQLKDILEMASSWGAVVLIDEADVFLEARNTHDLVRNSLVSVFLRLLERHTGVLILTTNRIRSFDSAFVSRFSIALHYPDLDQDSRMLIWKEFLSRAGFKIGEPKDTVPSRPLYISYSDLTALAKKVFNGRVIKQLVKGAQALAIAENEPLELSHIATVLEVTEQFEADWKPVQVKEGITDKLSVS